MRFNFAANKPPARHSSSGFTLMELMIVVAIVAILTALAIPSYSSYVDRAKRADARTQLLQAAQFMQKFYSANDSYSKDRAGAAVEIPSNLKQSPADTTAIYKLTITTPNPMSYTLVMTPVTPGSMAADSCGAFTLTSTGVRGIKVGTTVGDTAARDTCWK